MEIAPRGLPSPSNLFDKAFLFKRKGVFEPRSSAFFVSSVTQKISPKADILGHCPTLLVFC